MTTSEFVHECGKLLTVAKPHLVSCELVLGKDIPCNPFETYIPEEEYVLITCENGYIYKIPVYGNSLCATAEAIFKAMACK